MAIGQISDAFADIILTAILERDVSVIPTSYFIGLTLELPTDNNGTGIEAPTPGEYARVEVVATNTSWVSSGVGSRMKVSDVDVIFEQAVTDWGNIKGYTVYDALTGGVFLGYGILNPYIILAGTRARLPAGLIEFALL